jgi:hypothetical protein
MSQERVTIKLTGERPGPPPMTTFVVEARLHNQAARARWFILPSKLPRYEDGGVDVLQARYADGITLGEFLGTGGFWALQLPAGAELTIQNLKLSWWSEDPREFPDYPVIIADEVLLGGQPMRSWFARDPVCYGLFLDGDKAGVQAVHKTADLREVPVEFIEATRLTLQLRPPEN